MSDTLDKLAIEISKRPEDIIPLLKVLGLPTDFKFDSLAKMEEILLDVYPNGPEMPTTFIPLGWYLGETIIRNNPGAHWKENGAQYLDDIELEIPGHDGNGAIVRPFSRVMKFFNDNTDGLQVFAVMTRQIAAGLLNAKDKTPGQWYDMANGMKFRTLTPEQAGVNPEEFNK